MTTSGSPSNRSWIVAIYGDGPKPIGAGVVIDNAHVLTCRHVVLGKTVQQLRLAFPWAQNPFESPIEVRTWWAPNHVDADIAILRLAQRLPHGVEPARIRRPRGVDLFGLRWWAYGFQDRRGNDASGSIGADQGYGWVRLDTDSRYHIDPGFSGAGLWVPGYEAVVGLVGQRQGEGDGRCFTLDAAVVAFSDARLDELADKWELKAAGASAFEAWGWSLISDAEGRRHWRPRSRGVSRNEEQGYRFSGRTAALANIKEWLESPVSDRRVLVVTGSPGVGKSAVLARIVTTSDPRIVEELPAADHWVRAPLESIACAVHAKGKTSIEVAHEIARAVSAPLVERVEDSLTHIRERLNTRTQGNFTLVVDALDEAATPSDARDIVRHLLLPLARNCADVGARVLVGTRRWDDQGDLIGAFGAGRREIDLDLPSFFAIEDLTEYALASLQLWGEERPDSPYRDRRYADPVASRIAFVAAPNFLVTGLLSRSHGLYDITAVSPDSIEVPPGTDEQVSAALQEYLARIPDVGSILAADVFTALAYADAPGMPIDLWAAAIESVTERELSERALMSFAQGSAANFLIEHSDARMSYQLFHQALSDTLIARKRSGEQAVTDQAAITRRFLTVASNYGWAAAPAYLKRSLTHHAAAGRLIDEVLADDAFILHADLRRLISFLDRAASVVGKQRAELLRKTPGALDSPPPLRLALFSVTEAVGDLGESMRQLPAASPYRGVWAHVRQSADLATLVGHTATVTSVCALQAGGRDLVASAGDDETIRIWDPLSGETLTILQGHTGTVTSVCALQAGGRDLIASAGDDETIRIWDPLSGETLTILQGHTGTVTSVCALQAGGRDLIASAGDDEAIRIWDPLSGETLTILQGHTGTVTSVCALQAGGRDLVASAGDDEAIRIWDPLSGETVTGLEAHTFGVTSVCALQAGGRDLIASAGDDEAIRIWDPLSGETLTVLRGHTGTVTSVCALQAGGRDLIASAGDDGKVRLWDGLSGAAISQFDGHSFGVTSVCALQAGGRDLIASGSHDETIRIWDPLSGETSPVWRPTPSGLPVSVRCRQAGVT